MKLFKTVLIVLPFIIVLGFSGCSSKLKEGSNTDMPSGSTVTADAVSGDYVAIVGSEKITLPEYKYFMSGVKNQMEMGKSVNTADKDAVKNFWETKDGNETNAEKAITQSLDSLKELKILLIKAKEDMIQLNNEDLTTFNSYMEQIIASEGGSDDKKKAQEAISKKYGISFAEFEAVFKSSFLAYYKYPNEASKKFDVTDSEIKAFYDKDPSSFDQVTVRHILIGTTDSATGQALSGDKLEEKKKLADEILSKVKSGTDFGSLAKQYSEDPGSKDNGGEYTLGKGKMVQEFEDWAFKAKEGDTGIVKTNYGYHVMKFIKKEPYEKVKESVKKGLQSDLFKKKLEEWKKDAKYDVKRNQSVLDKVKLYQ